MCEKYKYELNPRQQQNVAENMYMLELYKNEALHKEIAALKKEITKLKKEPCK